MITHADPDKRAPTMPSKAWGKRDTSENCRERAAADLLKSVTMLTANERLILERSAARWTLRADMLEGFECTAAERAASATPSNSKGADHVRL
jgi:hypothetical protein